MSTPPVCTRKFKLNDGREIPAVGLGTWQGQLGTSEGDALKSSVIHALKHGYRLIDTAQYYGIEGIIGEAIRESGIPRSEITVVTKFWPNRFHDVKAALETSLKDLDIEYIDLFLMHWANTMTPDEKPMAYPGDPPYWEVWKNLEPLVGEKCRGIGVSNFTQKTLEVLLKEAKIVPLVNEIELHALNPALKLVPYCESKGIHVISWSTMGSERLDGTKNPILTHELFTSIAKKHNISAGVVSLSWAVQRGITVIPKSSKVQRIESNIQLVTLSDEEMDTINRATEKIDRIRLSEIIPGIQYDLNGKNTILGWSNADFGWEDEEGNWLD